MTSISQDIRQENHISAKMRNFFKEYHIARILKCANAYKAKGFPVSQIFMLLFSAIFLNRSIYMQLHLQKDSLPFGKDTVYRFLNSCHTNWRKFTLLLGRTIIKQTIEPLTSAERRNVLIIDDSMYSRSRSKKV